MKKPKNKIHIYLLILIIAIGITLRIMSFKSNTTPDLTLDDSSRDILVAMHIAKFNEHPTEPPYCGSCPKHFQNSINYYYFLSFFYRLTSSKSGIYLLFLASGIVLIPLTYLTAKILFNIPTALIAASLTAISPKLIYCSNFPLQPFLIPTLSCLIILLIILDYHKKSNLLIILAGIILFLSLQIHFSILILVPFYFFSLVKKRNLKNIGIAIILISPAIYWLVKSTYSPNPLSSFGNNIDLKFDLIKIISQTYSNILISFNWLVDEKYTILVPVIIVLAFIKFRKEINPILPLLISVLIIGFFNGGSNNFYDSPFLPVIIILFSASLFFLYQFKEMFFGFIFFSICYININNRITDYKNRNKNQMEMPTIKQITNNNSDKSKPIFIWEYSDYGYNILFQYYCQEEEKHYKPIISTKKYIDIYDYASNPTINKFLVCSNENSQPQLNNKKCQEFITNNLKSNYKFLFNAPDKYPNYVIYQLF